MSPWPRVNITCHVESRVETGGGGATCVHVEGLQVIYELHGPFLETCCMMRCVCVRDLVKDRNPPQEKLTPHLHKP